MEQAKKQEQQKEYRRVRAKVKESGIKSLTKEERNIFKGQQPT
jgi:hypothetical protein